MSLMRSQPDHGRDAQTRAQVASTAAHRIDHTSADVNDAIGTTAEHSQIASFLTAVQRGLYRHFAVMAVGAVVAALSGLAIVTPLAARLLVHARAHALSIASIASVAALGVVVTGFLLGVVVPRRRFAAARDLARWVGQQRPEIGSDLLSAVELTAPLGTTNTPYVSSGLIAAHTAAVAARLAPLKPAALLPARDRVLALRAGGVGLLLVAGTWFVPTVRQGWTQLASGSTLHAPTVELSQVPLIGDLDITLTYPAYTNRAPSQLASSSGDIRAPQGTHVALSGRALVPSQTATVVFEASPGQRAPRLAAMVVGDRVVAEFTITNPARYRFALGRAHGKQIQEQSTRTIEIEADRAPTVQLIAPADSLDVSNLRQIELAYSAEDDYGIAQLELVWSAGREQGRKALGNGAELAPGTTPATGTQAGSSSTAVARAGHANNANRATPPAPAATTLPTRSGGKLIWDMAELPLPPGAQVRYWLEARDNNNVTGANLGKSREFRLVVVSPREKHEASVARMQELAEALLQHLAERLPLLPRAANAANTAHHGPVLTLADRQTLASQVLALQGLAAEVRNGFDKDPHASDGLRTVLDKLKERLARLSAPETAQLVQIGKEPVRTRSNLGSRFVAIDTKWVAELEDDVLLLADWLDRERLEGMLDLADEVETHRKRLRDLLDEYAKSGDPKKKAEIEREMRALQAALGQLEQKRGGLPEDVVDQYVHREALRPKQSQSCLDEVSALFAAGKTAEAQAKLAACAAGLDASMAALESSLQALRDERFSDEQRKFAELMNELTDTAKDQDELAGEAARLFDEYARKADEVARSGKREANARATTLLERLRKQLASIPPSGLTPFSQEELDVAERRVADIERTLRDGDLAEAAAMAKQTAQSLGTMATELESANTDDHSDALPEEAEAAMSAVERARATNNDLIELLQKLAPAARDVLSAEDKRALERLRRRQSLNKERASKLGERAKQLGSELPGRTAEELGKRLGTATDRMRAADDAMRALDPGGARQATRAAAEALSQAREKGRDASRQRQEAAGQAEDPIRIPGAEEYKAPAQFREEILEAMKKRGPGGYDEMLRRYYQELVR